VLQLQKYTEGLNETEIYGKTTVSFVEGKGLLIMWLAYHPSALSSALLSITEVAGPQKNGNHY
jgi:hypothetical protein